VSPKGVHQWYIPTRVPPKGVPHGIYPPGCLPVVYTHPPTLGTPPSSSGPAVACRTVGGELRTGASLEGCRTNSYWRRSYRCYEHLRVLTSFTRFTVRLFSPAQEPRIVHIVEQCCAECVPSFHPFHCPTMVRSVPNCHIPGAIPGGLESSAKLGIFPFRCEKWLFPASGYSSLPPGFKGIPVLFWTISWHSRKWQFRTVLTNPGAIQGVMWQFWEVYSQCLGWWKVCFWRFRRD